MSESAVDRDHLERTAFAHSPYPDSYLTTEPEYRQFWNESRTGYIGYLQDRKYLHLIGGLIAPDNEREELLRQFTEYVDQNRYLASFFNIAEADRPLFQKYGYEATKFGENATIDLKGHSWGGKPYSWIRRQVSFVQRQGIVAREIGLEQLSEQDRHDAFARLQRMNEEQLSERVLPHEIGLLEGRLYPDHFYRRRLFVAHPENEPDNWQAFVACTPMENGRGWATEMYRSQKDAVRGITPFLFVQLIDTMKKEGVEFVSLCMVPAVNCGQKTPGDSWKTRYFLTLWEKRLNFLFNVQGLYHFKSRFRPEFEPVYLCVKPRITNGSTFSFLKCCGVFQMHWSNFFRLLKSRKKRAEQD
ncbi:bifunctional lysylphosphatidylglycerol flippase/synthetase MprF [Rubinisphaera margarita]|uniref:bifunctional lysylphosphatidylglycerol flippase/synthetase MprF n=1 Tax=Rubinisphaera margarita TaxID=2909586 RepID=UPI001EE9169F|nr:DUF2156 domain-containing protein [Rubinisphaera margarita]MCG6157455.1 DUF2156 domain-containing protein [Rubinisphaera margarita]